MVNIRKKETNNKVRVKSQNTTETVSAHYTTDFIAQSLAKDWAIKMNGLVDNTDYSSKYYATKSKLNKTETENMLAEAKEQAANAKRSVEKAYKAINQKLAPATDELLGGIKVGKSLYISDNGVLNTDAEHLDLYEKDEINLMLSEKLDCSDLPTNLSSFNNDIPYATQSSLNTLNSQVVKKTDIATANSLGIVKPDNNTIKIDTDGNLSTPITIDKITQFNAIKTGSVSEDKNLMPWIQHMSHSTFDRSKFTVNGNPIITDDGIAITGRSTSNVIRINSLNIPTNSEVEISFRYDYLVEAGGYNTLLNAFSTTDGVDIFTLSLDWTNNRFTFKNDIDDIPAENVAIQVGKSYDVKITTDMTSYLKLYLNGELKITLSITNAFPTIERINIGNANTPQSWFGENNPIDLKQFSIAVDGVEVFSGNRTGIDTIKPNDYTVIGSPTISADGVASGFSSSNYISVPYNYYTGHVKIITKFYWDGTTNFNNKALWRLPNNLWSNVLTGATDNRIAFYLATSSSSTVVRNFIYTLPSSGNYIVSIEFTGTQYIFEVYQNDNLVYTDAYTSTENFYYSSTTSQTMAIGGNSDYGWWSGSIDLNAFKIYVDGSLVYQPCLKIPYTESKTGSKIVNSIYRDRVNDMYEQFGYALYYTLGVNDFTLPMGEVYGMLEKRARDIAHPVGEPFYRLTDEIFDDEVRLEGAEVDKGLYLAIEQKLASYCFAGSDSTKIVLPNFIGRVPWGGNTQGYIEAGLPNITGTLGQQGDRAGLNSTSGAFVGAGSTHFASADYGVTGAPTTISLDASRSSSIYKNDVTTVQPPAFKVRWLARYK